MAKIIKIKEGLNLNLKGKASENMLSSAKKTDNFAVVPTDFVGFLPKVLVKAGDKVRVGDALMSHKTFPNMLLTSPVSGEVVAVNRGEKRKVLNIEIKADANQDYKEFDTNNLNAKSSAEILDLLLSSGMFAFFRQRPFDRVANPNLAPRDIFVTANFTAPLAPKFSFIAKGEEANIQLALNALKKLTSGKVYFGVEAGYSHTYEGVEQVEIHGAHPAGLVGTLINKTAPINKDETVWTLKATDLLVIGRFLKTGKVDFKRLVAITGSEAKETGYLELLPGEKFADTLSSILNNTGKNLRSIDGDVFTGTKFDANHDRVSLQTDQITIIPEGDDVHEIFGWAMPGLSKFSMSRSYFSWLMPKSKEYVLDARIKGGKRAMIMSNELSKVFAIDTYPEFLLKSIIAYNIPDMENRGIYEVAPEDFALCEFVDTSKMPLQEIVRNGLDLLYKEMN